MWQKNVRYLDYNASAGLSGTVRDQLTHYLKNEETGLANPSSRHRLGQKEHHLLFESARIISRSFGEDVTPDELIFTSSGTEANQAVIQSFVRSGYGIVIGVGEHSASFEMLEALGERHPNAWLTALPMTPTGLYDLKALHSLSEQAKQAGVNHLGISLFMANHETGVISDLEPLREALVCLPIASTLHLDGAQAWGKLPLDLKRSPADFVTFSSHKIGAPAGAGVIWKRKSTAFHPLFPGSQNSGLRGGSENLLGILGMRFASEEIDPGGFAKITAPLQRRLEQGVLERLPKARIWGSSQARVSNTVRLSFGGYEGYQHWMEMLDLRGFAVSHGSACRSSVIEPSRVLLAMGANENEALNSIRVSFGPHSHSADVDALLDALVEIDAQKRGVHP